MQIDELRQTLTQLIGEALQSAESQLETADLELARRFLENYEFGLAYDELLALVAKKKLKLSAEASARLAKAAEIMGLAP